jgi:hypothetical protein
MQIWRSPLVLGGAALAVVAIGIGSVPPARAAIEDAMSCALSTPCLEWDNTGSGDAVKGVSTKGNALHGQTKFKSAGKTAGKAGVFGEDLSTAGNLNAGVLGSSTNGTGVSGTSSTYNAVQGLSAISTGVYGQSAGAGGFGVAGRDISTTHGSNGAGVLADGGPADDGLHAFGNGSGANGVYAFSQSGTSLFANQGTGDFAPELYLQDTANLNLIIQAVGTGGDVLDVASGSSSLNGQFTITSDLSAGEAARIVNQPGNKNDTLDLFGGEPTSPTPTSNVIAAFDSNGVNLMLLNNTGNLIILGTLFQGLDCNSGCVQGNRRVHSVSGYAAVDSEPTIEDEGESALSNGTAEVALDPKFANVIDRSSTYIVTLTPEGDCRGLYVTDRTPSGFIVRELEGGRSNVGFAYRILAKRYGVQARGLQMTDVRRVAVPRQPTHH